MWRDFKVLLAPTWELAKELNPIATVEAEYGSNVLEGELVTLAHHVEKYKDQPAPCNAKVTPLPGDEGDIVVSHLDLDTLGGILGLLSLRHGNEEFWEGVEFVDLNGPHRIHELPQKVQNQIQAYWAWNEFKPLDASQTKVTDITKHVQQNSLALRFILENDKGMIDRGKEFARSEVEKVEACLIEEDDRIRVFATNGPFTAASYYSPSLQKSISLTISYNTQHGSITLATCDKSLSCREVMQELFGKEAGGHASIAGSPRGKRMTLADFNNIVEMVRLKLNEI